MSVPVLAACRKFRVALRLQSRRNNGKIIKWESPFDRCVRLCISNNRHEKGGAVHQNIDSLSCISRSFSNKKKGKKREVNRAEKNTKFHSDLSTVISKAVLSLICFLLLLTVIQQTLTYI